MKPLSEQDHYEILEVSRDATAAEIERAYRMARATFDDDSLAGYSVFGDSEAQAIRERIGMAYRVLSDAESRSAYDASLAGASPPPREYQPRLPEIELPELPEFPEGVAPPAASEEPMPIEELEDLEELEQLDDASGEFDGARLHRMRLHRGMEIEDISGVTKINPTYLRFIEEDRYADLPAPVYVRGFVTAYAQCIGLDAKRVAASYMKRVEASTGNARRGRFLGGR